MGKIKGVNVWLVLIDCSPCSRNTTQKNGFHIVPAASKNTSTKSLLRLTLLGKIEGVNFWLVLIDCSPCSRNTTQEKGFLSELLKSAKNWIKVAENIIFTKDSGWSKIVLRPMLLASFWTKLLPTNHYLFKANKKIYWKSN